MEQESCLFLRGGQDTHPTKKLNLGGTGILPVANQFEKASISF
ncbi:hypothetical protein [Microcoleus asticus]|nr:hypothetical protein [Microcoleus asticus]